ncbi:TnsD family Tn7-like transposition protein [Paraburkholderia hospita]|uniref:TnsD family Tn7-like transposition protein n=1 Tax=Paraburkholderia hospita TaxID=169430 RepID=UPI001FC95534|nr:TnsD family Tn7-like transposition protein [Paraburkholderia hospita]
MDPTSHTRALAVTIEDFATLKDSNLMDEYPLSSFVAAADIARLSASIVNRFDECLVDFPYEQMFREAGLSSQSGALNQGKVWEAVVSYFGEKFCSDTGIEQSAMLRRFWAQETNARICPRPFRYLALQSLLVHRASLGGSPSLVGSRRARTGVGNTPLCCQPTRRTRRGAFEVTCENDLRVLADRFGCSGRFHRPDDSYARIELVENTGNLIFSCTCEHRVTVAFNEAGSMRAVKVLQYGSPYVKAFTRLVRRGLTPVAAAARLGVSNTAAYLWERRIAGVERSTRITTQRIEENREQWRIACAQLSAEIGFMDLRRQFPSTYSFLVRNNAAWLREFNKSIVDAQKSQLEHSFSPLLAAAKERLAAVNPPVWMSCAAIWKSARIDRRVPLLSSPARELIGQLVESKVAYRDRVIDFWMKELDSSLSVYYWSFLKRCHIADQSVTDAQRRRIKSWLSARGQLVVADGAFDRSLDSQEDKDYQKEV